MPGVPNYPVSLFSIDKVIGYAQPFLGLWGISRGAVNSDNPLTLIIPCCDFIMRLKSTSLSEYIFRPGSIAKAKHRDNQRIYGE